MMASSDVHPEPHTSDCDPLSVTYDVEKMITEIVYVIQNDSELESFDIIPESTVKLSSPVIHREHNLGLESWCIEKLYAYVHTKALMKTPDVESKTAMITVAILINPHVRTFWNMRRELVLQKKLNLSMELKYVALVLSFKPKTQEAFHYRKWLMKQICEEHTPYSLLDELAVVERAAECHQNNHTAWDYCSWLLNEVLFFPDDMTEFWRSLVSWISVHVSDASAINFQQQLIRKLINYRYLVDINFKRQIISFASVRYFDAFDDDDLFIIGLLLHDFELTEDLIVFYKGHESLWYHRQFLSYFWINELIEKVSKTGKELLTTLPNEDGVSILEETFSQMHGIFLMKIADQDYVFAQRYKDWMQYLNVKF